MPDITTSSRVAVVLDGDTGPGLAVTRSLGRAGWTVLVAAASRSERSRFAHRSVEIPDAARDPDRFMACVRDVVDRRQIDIVVPTTDASLAGAWEAIGGRERPRILGGDRRTVAMALDKVACLETAERHGFPVPEWRAPGTPDDAYAALGELGMPLVVKPRRSYRRLDRSLEHRRHQFVYSPDDLDEALVALGDGDVLPLMQQYAPGRALSVTAVVSRGVLLTAIARETLTFYPVRGGTSVWKRTVGPSDAGVAEAVRFLQNIGLEGVAEVEYQVGTDGVPRLMEVGARLHGWVPLAIAAGVDLPRLAASAAVDDPVDPVPSYRVGMEMRWPAGEVRRLRTLLGPRRLLPPGMRRRDIVAGMWPPWRPGMKYDGFDTSDLRPLYRPLPAWRPSR